MAPYQHERRFPVCPGSGARMAKAKSLESKLARLRLLADEPPSANGPKNCGTALADTSNLVVAAGCQNHHPGQRYGPGGRPPRSFRPLSGRSSQNGQTVPSQDCHRRGASTTSPTRMSTSFSAGARCAKGTDGRWEKRRCRSLGPGRLCLRPGTIGPDHRSARADRFAGRSAGDRPRRHGAWRTSPPRLRSPYCVSRFAWAIPNPRFSGNVLPP